MRRLAVILFLALGLIGSIALFNALNFRPQPQPPVTPAKLHLEPGPALERLAGALRIVTVSHEDPARLDATAFRALHEYLERQFPLTHRFLNRETVSEYSLLYTWPGSDATLAPLLLLGHLDVVPVEPGSETAWQHPPFGGAIADGFVWGRGALDDKSGVLAQLEAVETLLAEGFQPRRTIYLAFGHDEEVGGRDGAARIAEMLGRLGVRPALVLDEGGVIASGSLPGLAAPAALVGIAEKGYLSLLLSADSPGGHSSMPPPQTAVGILAHAIARLEDRPLPARLTPPVRRMLDGAGRHMSLARRLLLANLWLGEPLLLRGMSRQPAGNAMIRSTTAATMFSGSSKQNILPARAAAVVNFRILQGETRKSVVEHVRRAIDDERVKISALTFGSEPSPVSPADSPAFAMLETSIRQSVAAPELVVTPYLVMGATDARHYAGLSRFVYRFRPYRLDDADLVRFHGSNERIGVEQYVGAVRFYWQLLRNSNEAVW